MPVRGLVPNQLIEINGMLTMLTELSRALMIMPIITAEINIDLGIEIGV
jgi:hypothetical protein